ncbi:MAG: diguanylate cyclase [Pseudomonadota bacterium]|nr:diguanylate cyclase [Pseudomonadota bacterium]
MVADMEQESNLLEFMYACPVGLVEIDRLGSITMINPHAMKHLLPIASQNRQDMTNLFNALEDCAPELRNLFEHFEPSRGTVCENHRIVVDLRRRGEGGRKILACTMVKLGTDRAIVTFADVTTQVEQEHRLKLADTWFSSLLDGVNDYAVLTITADGIIETVNDAFTRQTGHPCLDVRARPLAAVLGIDGAPGSSCMSDHLCLARSDGWSLDEGWQHRRNGERYWCQRLIVARVGDDGTTVEGYTVVLRDVVHQSIETSDLRRLLTQDHLTGAANRAHFLQRFDQALRLWQQNGQPLSLVLVDVDHFKSINDRYGHPAGDEVLRSLAQTCMAVLRPGCLFSRLGGEEFAALLPNTTRSEALSIAERLRAAVVAGRTIVSGQEVAVTASFGCVTAEERDGTIDELIKMADERLYEAKRSGRNRVCGPYLLAEVSAVGSF